MRDQHAALEAVIENGGTDGLAARERLERLQASARLSAGQDRLLTRSTRSPKQQLATRADLDCEWRQAGQAHGLDGERLDQLRAAGRMPEPAGERELLRRLTELDATFADRDARAVALEASVGVRTGQALRVMHQLHAGGELLHLSDGRQTTRRHRHAEHQTVRLARELATSRVPAIAPASVVEHAARLDDELTARGGRLSVEQRQALLLACSDAQLVMIEGQAGTGKSTVLIGVARAHQDDGQQIIVTSTAALAAQRLAGELGDAGVAADSYSTAGLKAAIASGRIELRPEVTVIHDEAALAATREQQHLLSAVKESGARLILIGDPLQSQPVGAGGLWPEIEKAALEQRTRADLTRNVRALDPADQRDQARFRADRHDQAIRGYHDRGRVTITSLQRQAEDAALDAAGADRQAGQRTLVIAQTSNEHLDELNARAQAIRQQNGELGEQALDLPGRPYQLHDGDLIQVRHTITHGQLGQIRNGQTGLVTRVHDGQDELTVQFEGGRRARLGRDQIDRGDLRLAYVQHPFPAQGQTTDTAHLIVAEHATREGTYVAITRPRHTAHLYTSHQQLGNPKESLAALAEHVGRSEPDVPSIHTPLAHEINIDRQQALALTDPGSIAGQRPEAEPTDQLRRIAPERLARALSPQPEPDNPTHHAWQQAAVATNQYRDQYDVPDEEPRLLGPEPAPGACQQRLERRDAARLVHDSRQQLPAASLKQAEAYQPLEIDSEEADRQAEASPGWEP